MNIILKEAFYKFLQTHPRSNEKLKILHGFIAQQLLTKIELNGANSENFRSNQWSIKSYGVGNGKEEKIQGRYMHKNVDITVLKNGDPVFGLAIKFVMSNYSQNANNYFEGLLGETANIRANNILYSSAIFIADSVPYFDKDGNIKKWENTLNHLQKYKTLGRDNKDTFYHSPNKNLIYIYENPIGQDEIDKASWKEYYLNNRDGINFRKKNIESRNGDLFINKFDEFIEAIALECLTR